VWLFLQPLLVVPAALKLSLQLDVLAAGPILDAVADRGLSQTLED
jgi:hypothetical protein